MKKVFIPSIENLSRMEEYDVDIYKYIIIKTVEVICANNVNNNINLNTVYKYLTSDYYISKGVCSVFPEQIKYSNLMSYDVDLCRTLINRSKDNSIYNLNELSKFNSNTLKNSYIIDDSVEILSNNLKNNPEYRFLYEDNTLLNDIFSTKVLDYYNNMNNLNNLINIEPYYAVLLGNKFDIKNLLTNGINNYASRYNVYGNINPNKDNLNSPKVKRLVNFINKNK